MSEDNTSERSIIVTKLSALIVSNIDGNYRSLVSHFLEIRDQRSMMEFLGSSISKSILVGILLVKTSLSRNY